MTTLLAGIGLLVIMVGAVLFGAGAGWLVAGLQSVKGGKAVALILTGMFVGFIAGGFLGVLSFAEIKKHEVEVHRGWNLKPVVVAAVDIEPGQLVTFDVISQRSIPEKFVTEAAVVPDKAMAIVGKRARVALKAGDVIYWGFTCP